MPGELLKRRTSSSGWRPLNRVAATRRCWALICLGQHADLLVRGVIGVATPSARVSRIKHLRVKTQRDVLPERLRNAAGAIRRDGKVEA